MTANRKDGDGRVSVTENHQEGNYQQTVTEDRKDGGNLRAVTEDDCSTCLCVRHCRSGWSLIELTVVLVILGMVAATVSLSMRGVWARFQAARVLDTVLDLDDRARQLSVASGRSMELALDGDGKVVLRYSDGRVVKQANLAVPSGLELVCVSQGTVFRRDAGFQIPYSTAGTSPVLLLGLPSKEGLASGPEWVAVLAGGQRKRFESRELAERWLRGNE